MSGRRRVPRIGICTLGCAKNLYDAQRLASALLAFGYRLSDYTDSRNDAVIVNTCGFIGDAQAESFEVIAETLSAGTQVIVTGCMGSLPELIRSRFPEVAAVTPPGSVSSVLRAVTLTCGRPAEGRRKAVMPPGVLLTPPHYAYLKIAEGCRHRCSYCIIPSLRGSLRSRLPDLLCHEADALAASGVRELIVIAQDSSDYGLDLPGGVRLADLCRRLSRPQMWLRVHYVYPGPEADRLTELMAEGLVLPYLDVPLQHAEPRLLKAMRRPGNAEKALRQIEHWRQICPGLTIRSTFITGFPGETAEDFETLLEFLREARLDRVGCFPFSAVDGCAAASLPDQVPEEIREERAERLMEVQEEISAQKLATRVGQITEVLVDDVSGAAEVTGRTCRESPEVDGVVYVRGEGADRLRQGDLVRVQITGSDEHDLFATLCP